MGFRFRKSIKIAPGVKWNIGKKSTGLSIGGKYGGISFNSKSGTRIRTSLYGTGLSYSKKIGAQHNSAIDNATDIASDVTSSVIFQPHVEVSTVKYFWITLFGGFIGAHRFYRKQYLLGFIYLFTVGIFGIGYLIDLTYATYQFIQYLIHKPRENR